MRMGDINIPQNTLQLCRYVDISKYHKVYSLYDVPFYWYIKIPDELNERVSFVGIYEFGTGLEPIPDIQNFVCRECKRPWLRIRSERLKTDIGLHVYRIDLIDIHTDDLINMYISYTIQSDDPEKPYVYMDR